MKATLAIGGLFFAFMALFIVVDWIVGLGMDPIGPDAQLTPDQEQAVAEGYAVLPPAPVIFEHIDGVFVPPVRR